MTRCYVAAPYLRAPVVRGVHDRLRRHDIEVTSTWADHALARDPLDRDRETLNAERAANFAAIDSSEIMIVLAYDLEGGEMFVDFARALWGGGACGRVYWVGRTILSTADPLVMVCASVDEAVTRAVTLANSLRYADVLDGESANDGAA